MKNKEKYVDELLKYATKSSESFGVEKNTGRVCSCNWFYVTGMKCSDCIFKSNENCYKQREKWLEEEYKEPVKTDYWKDFRHLKPGDTVLVRSGDHYSPVIVIELNEWYLHYACTFDENGDCIIHATTTDPDMVRLIKED